MKVGNYSPRIARMVFEWYALKPEITRLWVYEAGEAGSGDARDVQIVAVTPRCDGVDGGEKRSDWQTELQSIIGRSVRLDVLEAWSAPPRSAYPRRAWVCLASIGWRDCWTACSTCPREIPLSTAAWREGSDYVAYFWGLDCYDQWRNQ